MRNKVVKKSLVKNTEGFTLVEMIVVVVVIAILSGISLVGYNEWEKNSITAQLKSDLNNVASAMENARNFGSGYPLTPPNTFKPSSGVTLSGGGSADGKSYCINATSSRDSSLVFHIDSTDTGRNAQTGSCS